MLYSGTSFAKSNCKQTTNRINGLPSLYYDTPSGLMHNSRLRMTNGSGAFGRFGPKVHFSVGTKLGRSYYGVPFAQESHGDGHEYGDEGYGEEEDRVPIVGRRNGYRMDWGLPDLGGRSCSSLSASVTDRVKSRVLRIAGKNRLAVCLSKENSHLFRGSLQRLASSFQVVAKLCFGFAKLAVGLTLHQGP